MKINLIAPINNLSYGLVGNNILKALTDRGHEVALFPINPQNMEAEPHFHTYLARSLANARGLNLDLSAPCIRLWHQFDMSQFVGKGKKIGFPIFELDRFTELENLHLANGCDSIFVCSKWAKEIIHRDVGKIMNNCSFRTPYILPYKEEDVKVVPLGVDTDIFFPSTSSRRKTTVFLNVGKWEVRKGHAELIDAFNKAFTNNDNVELWLMSENIFLKPEKKQYWENLALNSPLGNKIRLITRVESQSQVADIMRQADFGVFPAKAEGWNLDLLEMLACGKRVIATNYSGHTEFCSSENSLLLDIERMEPAVDDPWFYGQGNWAIPNIEQLIRYMKECYMLKQSGEDITNYNGIETAKRFSWENTAIQIEEAIK